MKKKLLCPLLAIMMCVSLTACGGGDNTTTAPSGSGGAANEQMEELTKAYDQIADLYNDVADKVEKNGWTADEEITATLQIVNITLDPVGKALDGDESALDGADLGALASQILEYQAPLEELAEKVSVPYEGSGE